MLAVSAVEESHGCRSETLQSAAAVSATSHEDIRDKLGSTLGKRSDDVDESSCVRAQRVHLRLEPFCASETDSLHFGSFRGARLADVLGFAGSFGRTRLRIVLVDVNADFRARHIGLHL